MTTVQSRPAPAGGGDGHAPATTPSGRPSSRGVPAAPRQTELTVAPTVALTALTAVVALGFGRLYAGSSHRWPLLLAALVPHAVAWLCRAMRWSGVTTLLLSLATVVLLATWTVLPDTTVLGLPTGETLTVAREQLDTAYAAFRQVVAPAPVTDGFLLASVLAVATTALLSDWAAFRSRATYEAAMPAFTLFLFVAILGVEDGRALAVALFLVALLLFLAVHQAAVDGATTPWFSAPQRATLLPLVPATAGIAGAVVLAASLLGPNLPGADEDPLIAWRNNDDDSVGTRTTVSPLVDIRGRLVERSNVEVFTVTSAARAYWRLTSLDQFDGEIWSSKDSYRDADGRLGSQADEPPGGQPATQDYEIAALSSIWLPAAYLPQRVGGVENLSYNRDSASLISAQDTSDGLRYHVESVIPRLTAAGLNGAGVGGLAAADLARYLAVPPLTPRLRNLALQATGGGTPYQRARALQDFFHSGRFTYDLRVSQGHDGRALERFLFENRRGYCEQFAGSYAVLARLAGLPARVAVGFTPGELGPDGVFHVRDLHAHAWPEVFLDGFGWVAFEPTPGRGAPFSQDYTGLPEAQASATNPNTATTVAPDAPAPAPAAQQGGAPTTTAPPNVETTPGDAGGNTSGGSSRAGLLIAVLALVVAWGAGVPVAYRVRRQRRRTRARTAGDRVALAWVEASEALARAGVSRRTGETMSELGRRAAVAARLPAPAATALRTLATDADVASYAPAPPTPDTVARARAASATVEQAVAHNAALPRRLLWAIDPRMLLRPGSGQVSPRA